MWGELLSREMDGPYYRERSADLAQVAVPLLSAANWGGQGLPHSRQPSRGFVRSSSRDKGWKCTAARTGRPFYTDYGRRLQLDFFDHFLKGRQNGWTGSAACCSTCGIPASASFRATRTNGHSSAPSGRPSISILINTTSPVTQ